MSLAKLIIASSLFVSVFSSAFAASKIDKCSLFVADPVITHAQYGTNNGPNKVNAGVLRILQNNGFSISTNASKARYTMNTEVRCGQTWTMFGIVDACQTEVTFTDNAEEKIVFTDGPTIPTPGLKIDFNSIRFPSCSDL